ncbi:hypothetical protein, conserved [Eimeria necatrix]|uniref:Uncharacterized protein n=1 Tax=Eimeria necatrix TaxID=51315 RepID=U6N1S9_9EIME|nr:hypothetical protein, conserved [Eimeria necatrix]CDJ68704.1 hypothetical protein, conserved [Eimeria necatrix]
MLTGTAKGPSDSRGPPAESRLAFPSEVQGLPVVATAVFLDGKCRQMVTEGTVPVCSGASTSEHEPSRKPGAPGEESSDDPKLISRSLEAAEKATMQFLAAAAKGSAAGKDEEADTVGNDPLGLDDD